MKKLNKNKVRKTKNKMKKMESRKLRTINKSPKCKMRIVEARTIRKLPMGLKITSANRKLTKD